MHASITLYQVPGSVPGSAQKQRYSRSIVAYRLKFIMLVAK